MHACRDVCVVPLAGQLVEEDMSHACGLLELAPPEPTGLGVFASAVLLQSCHACSHLQTAASPPSCRRLWLMGCVRWLRRSQHGRSCWRQVGGSNSVSGRAPGGDCTQGLDGLGMGGKLVGKEACLEANHQATCE